MKANGHRLSRHKIENWILKQEDVKDIMHEISKLEKMIIQQPISKKQVTRNWELRRKILHERAKADVVSGVCPSVRSAALKYHLSDSTLGSYIKGRATLIRKKNRNQFLTEEEEESVLKR